MEKVGSMTKSKESSLLNYMKEILHAYIPPVWMKASPYKPASGTCALEKERNSDAACALHVLCLVPSLLRTQLSHIRNLRTGSKVS